MLVASVLATAVAAPHAYSCDQTTLVDANLRQHLDFVVDSSDTARWARVTNVATGATLIANRVQPRPNYDGGYWMTNYGLEAWNIGWSQGDRYTLLLPQAPLGTQLDAQVHILFQGGSAGGWQNEFHCTRLP